MPRREKYVAPFELELLPTGSNLKRLNPGWVVGGDYDSPGRAEGALIERLKSERGWMAARIRQYGPGKERFQAHLFGKFLITDDQIKRVG